MLLDLQMVTLIICEAAYRCAVDPPGYLRVMSTDRGGGGGNGLQ